MGLKSIRVIVKQKRDRMPQASLQKSRLIECCALSLRHCCRLLCISKAKMKVRSLVPLRSIARSRNLVPRLLPSIPSCSLRPFSTTSSPHAQVTRQPQPRAYTPLMMPDNMPREDYATPAMYTINYISRIFKYLVLTAVTTGTAAFVAFEGMHFYIEKVCLSPVTQDEWGWGEEVISWTGGGEGGTDGRLGSKARHAIRGAWVCQEWGAGLTGGTIGRGREGGEEVRANGVDVGYEMAERCLDLAIADANQRGLAFPPTLSETRLPGPGYRRTPSVEVDSTAVDLMLLKAGVLERMSTGETLSMAKEMYETVWAASSGEARVMRSAGKVGDLCARIGRGDEAMAWWGWGLSRAGVQMPTQPTGPSTSETNALAPAVRRATITLLASASAHLATTSQLPAASSLQNLALSLLPSAHPLPPPTELTAPAVLHDTWLQHRIALFTLHHSSVLHALGQHEPALLGAETASSLAESVISAISPIPREYFAYNQQANALHRDALLLGAEAAYTRGALLERSGSGLQVVADSYQRAMGLSATESGQTDEGKMGDDAKRYWRAYARVKANIDG